MPLYSGWIYFHRGAAGEAQQENRQLNLNISSGNRFFLPCLPNQFLSNYIEIRGLGEQAIPQVSVLPSLAFSDISQFLLLLEK